MKSIISEEKCAEILEKYSKSAQSELINYTITKISEEAIGFLGDHFQLTINYQDGKNSIKKIDFFLKTMPQSNNIQNEYIQKTGYFEKEKSAYKYLLNKMQEISSKKICAKSYLIEPSYIVLEDLSLRKYKNYEGTYLNFNHCKSILETLARFHASSIIFEMSLPSKIGTHFKNIVQEVAFNFTQGHPRQKIGATFARCLLNCIKLIPEYTNNKLIEINLNKLAWEDLQEFNQPSKKYRNVLIHDDLWRNNIMFNPDLECVLIDFQFVRYAPPALDILVMLYLNFEKNCLHENFDKFIRIYYETFGNELKMHGLAISDFLTHSELLESLQVYKGVALYESAMYASSVFISKELSKLILSDNKVYEEFYFNDRSKFICREFEDPDFRSRFSNVLDPLIELLNHE